MEERWTQLEEWIETNAPAFASTLRPPATAAEIDAAETELGVTFPPSVRQTYLIHNGDDAHWYGVLGYPILPLSDIVEKTQFLRGIDGDFDYDFWDDSLIPLLKVTNGDYLCVSDAPDGAETTFLRWDHESSIREELDPSFAAYVDAVLDAFEAGDYEYDEEKRRLDVDVSIRRH